MIDKIEVYNLQTGIKNKRRAWLNFVLIFFLKSMAKLFRREKTGEER